MGSGQMEITLRPGETLEPADPDTAPKVPTSNSDDKGIVIEYTAPSATLMYEDIKEYIKEYNVDNTDNPIVYDYKKSSDNSWILSLLPNIILLVALIAFYIYIMRKMSGGLGGDVSKQMGFGKTKIKI